MATQRLMIATLAEAAANQVRDVFSGWRTNPDPAALDRFCVALRDNCLSLSVLYFAEWVDRWLMGDLIPGPDACEGSRFQAACMSPNEARAWAGRCGQQFPEQESLAARLREAAAAWEGTLEPRVVLVVREVVGPSATDEEIIASLRQAPPWLAPQ